MICDACGHAPHPGVGCPACAGDDPCPGYQDCRPAGVARCGEPCPHGICPECGTCRMCERLESPALRLGRFLQENNIPILFGLRAQGHLPTIERMLAEGASWQRIGRAIGWDPATAERHYKTETEEA